MLVSKPIPALGLSFLSIKGRLYCFILNAFSALTFCALSLLPIFMIVERRQAQNLWKLNESSKIKYREKERKKTNPEW